MEDCEETIFEKGETIETNEIKEEPPANKKEENQIKKDEKDLHIKSIVDIKKGYFCSQCSSLMFLFFLMISMKKIIVNKNIIN